MYNYDLEKAMIANNVLSRIAKLVIFSVWAFAMGTAMPIALTSVLHQPPLNRYRVPDTKVSCH